MSPRTTRVLLVEDNPGDAELATERLAETAGGLVSTAIATSLRDATARLAHSEYEIVILDLNLPDSVGPDTLRALRRLRPQTPFLVLSGGMSEAERRAALGEGATEVVSKEEASARLFGLAVLCMLERGQAAEHQRRLEALLDLCPDAVLIVDEPDAVQYVNQAATELYGKPREALLGEPATFDARPGEPHAEAHGESVELRIARADGERIGRLRVVEFEWRGRRSTLAMIRDVTEQRRLEMQLVLSDRMVSMGTLAAGVAHEINNPLVAVLSNIDLATRTISALVERGLVPAEVQDELQDAREAAGRVAHIVRDLQVFSRPEKEGRSLVDIHRVLDSTLRMAWNEIRHRARLVKDYCVPAPGPVDANEARLGQVFLNLVINAAQAIPIGHASDNEVRVSTATDEAGRVIVTVSDTGGGIAPEVQARLFTPFFTTKPLGTGTGLGLAISQRIVNGFGGQITFESQVGVGTRFRVTLPGAAPSVDAPVPPRAPEGKPAPRRARILVIDDEAIILRAIRHILGQEHEVAVSESARHALELLAAGADYDLILCDLMMPEMTGMEFLRHVQELHAPLTDRVVFMTGGSFTTAGREFLDSVSNLRLEKPFDTQGLRSLINRFLR